MRCSGQIYVDQAANVLGIPVHAVFSKGRERFVYVPASGGRVKAQPVQIGKSNEMYVEIRSGLAEGDRVLLREPRPGEIDQPAEKDGAKGNEKAGVIDPNNPPPDPTKFNGNTKPPTLDKTSPENPGTGAPGPADSAKPGRTKRPDGGKRPRTENPTTPAPAAPQTP